MPSSDCPAPASQGARCQEQEPSGRSALHAKGWDGMGQGVSHLPALSCQAEMHKLGSIITMRPRWGELSPAPPVAVFVSSSEEGSWPRAALSSGKHTVVAHLLCQGLAVRRSTPQTPREAPLGTGTLTNATLHPSHHKHHLTNHPTRGRCRAGGCGAGWSTQSPGEEQVPRSHRQSCARAQLPTALGERRWDTPSGTDHSSHLSPSTLHALPQTSDQLASELDRGTARRREATAGNL